MFVWSDVLTKIRLLTYGHILLKSSNLKDSFHTILHFCSGFEVFAIMKNIFSLFACLVWGLVSLIKANYKTRASYGCKMAIFFILFSLLLYFFSFTIRAVCILFTQVLKSKNIFSRGFFLKIQALCMVSIQERFLIKSGL